MLVSPAWACQTWASRSNNWIKPINLTAMCGCLDLHWHLKWAYCLPNYDRFTADFEKSASMYRRLHNALMGTRQCWKSCPSAWGAYFFPSVCNWSRIRLFSSFICQKEKKKKKKNTPLSNTDSVVIRGNGCYFSFAYQRLGMSNQILSLNFLIAGSFSAAGLGSVLCL